MFYVPFQRVNVSTNFENLEKFCLDTKQNDVGRSKSNWGGWQSNDLHLKDYPAEFQFFITELLDKAREFASEIGLDENLGLGNSWININYWKDSNKKHVHPGSILSGIYYVKTPPKSGKLVFDHPAQMSLGSYWPVSIIKTFKESSSAVWRFTPKQGDFFIFPAWLHHEVEPHENKDEERISIAFNFYY